MINRALRQSTDVVRDFLVESVKQTDQPTAAEEATFGQHVWGVVRSMPLLSRLILIVALAVSYLFPKTNDVSAQQGEVELQPPAEPKVRNAEVQAECDRIMECIKGSETKMPSVTEVQYWFVCSDEPAVTVSIEDPSDRLKRAGMLNKAAILMALGVGRNTRTP